jgi:MFS family permease
MIKILRHLFPLFVVQFFTWLALFSLWIYATPVITRYVFNSTEADSPAFEEGVIWVGICFALYSTLAAFLAFALPSVLKKISKEKLHAVALLIGGVGLLLIYFIKNKYLLFFSFAFIGIAWSSISNIPYSIIGSIAPENKMVNYFAVFNFSIVIPQVTAAFLLGFISNHFFKGQTIYVMILGGCSMLLAGVIMFLIPDLKEKEG